MFGKKKKTGATPLPWLRGILGAVVMLLGLWFVIKLAVADWIETGAAGASEDNEIEYDSTFFRVNGDFGANGVRLVHFLPDGRQMEYEVDRVVMHTPGFFWLLKNAWFGNSDHLPPRIGITLENPRNAADTGQTPGNYTNLPYDAMGCGVNLLTPDQIARMGMSSVQRTVTGTLTQMDGARSLLHIVLETANVGAAEMDLVVDYMRPMTWEQSLVALGEATVSKSSLTFRDLGFIPARNSYCAKQAGLADAQFSAHHMREMAVFVQKFRTGYGPETLSRYRQFATEGGELHIDSTAPSKSKLKQLNMGSGFQPAGSAPQIRFNEGAPAEFEFGAAYTIASTALPEAEALPAGPAVTVANPAIAAPAVAVDSVVSYRQLKELVGAHIEITTSLGSVRRGTLLSYGTYMSNLKLDASDGGFNMAIPADTVVQVRHLSTPADSGSSTGADNAQTH